MKILLLAFTLSIFTNMCDGRVAAVPDAVKQAFKAQYPNAVDVEWEIVDKGFEAEFRDGNKKMEVLFDADGKVLKAEVDEVMDDDDEGEEEGQENEDDDDDKDEEKDD